MIRLYEDILDDLDSIGKKSPTETLIEDSAKENFDYILYIGHQIKHNYKKELQIQEIENDYQRPLQKLKEKMDVCLDSYWTDEIIYYQELVDAIAEAIEQSETLDGAKVVDSAPIVTMEEKLDFNAVRAEAAELWGKLTTADENNAVIILKKIEMTMGHKMKLSEFTEDQCDLLALVVAEMRDM